MLLWVEQVVGDKCEDQNDIGISLRNGVMLCKLINCIEPGSIKKIGTKYNKLNIYKIK